MHLRFVWPAWHLWHWAGSSGGLWPGLVAGDAAALCVTGAALGDIAWQAWHVATSSVVSRGSCGTYGTGLALVVLSSFPLSPFPFSFPSPFSFPFLPFSFPFLLSLSFSPFSFLLSPFSFPSSLSLSPLQMERGAKLCVAGVPLGDIHLSFAWQAWHLVTSTFVLLGKRGTYGTGLALVAGFGRF